MLHCTTCFTARAKHEEKATRNSPSPAEGIHRHLRYSRRAKLKSLPLRERRAPGCAAPEAGARSAAASLLRARPGAGGRARPGTPLPGGSTPAASGRGVKGRGQESGGAGEGPAAGPCAIGYRRAGGCRRRGDAR